MFQRLRSCPHVFLPTETLDRTLMITARSSYNHKMHRTSKNISNRSLLSLILLCIVIFVVVQKHACTVVAGCHAPDCSEQAAAAANDTHSCPIRATFPHVHHGHHARALASHWRRNCARILRAALLHEGI